MGWILEQGVCHYRSVNRLLIEAKTRNLFPPNQVMTKQKSVYLPFDLLFGIIWPTLLLGHYLKNCITLVLESIKSQGIWADWNFEEVWDF